MNKKLKILVINPGSTSTKIAVFEEETLIFQENIQHTILELAGCKKLQDEYLIRYKKIIEIFKKNNFNLKKIDAIISRGAPLKPLESGTYQINQKMLEDLKNENIQSPHISILAPLIASELAEKLNLPAFMADPISVDEFEPLARISGLPEIERKSLWHALNCKAVAKEAAKDLGKKYEDLNLIVVHLGSGITVSSHKKGKAVDVNNANSEGPFSPERAGALPIVELVKLCFSGKYSQSKLINKVTRTGGLRAYLGTNDARIIEEKIKQGDQKSLLIYQAMAYQIAKEICAYAAPLNGKVDLIILTGALAFSQMLVNWITDRISFIAPIKIFPGENELTALNQAALRALKGIEKIKEYI